MSNVTSVYPDYKYEGDCNCYATYGRAKASDFKDPIDGKEILSLDPKTFSAYGNLDANFEKYKGVEALHVTGIPLEKNHPDINPKEPNPFIGLIAYPVYKQLPVNLTKATHLQIKVLSKTEGTLVLELYDGDSNMPEIERNKNNYFLPVRDDLFKIVLKLKPSSGWQTLTIPLKKFVDWNRKQEGCNKPIKGINEDIGNGHLDPKKGEAFMFQMVFASDKWDRNVEKEVYVGSKVRFLKIPSQK